MTKKEFYAKVEQTMKDMGISKGDMYTYNDLEKIAKTIGVQTTYVMIYLRYGKVF